MNKLNQLQEAIIELVPEIRERVRCFTGEISRESQSVPLPNTICVGGDITLADVLMAMNDKAEFKRIVALIGFGVFIFGEDVEARWNLEKNALHLQDEPTIHFLHDVICKSS